MTRQLFWNVQNIDQYDMDAVYDSKNFPNKPDKTELLYSFDAPSMKKTNFAQRIFGWFLPPLTGAYIFYTSCDDICDLFVSPNEVPRLKLKMVSQKDWSEHNQFDR